MPCFLQTSSILKCHDEGTSSSNSDTTLSANSDQNEEIGAADIEIYPIFIFDGESAGTKICGYNRMKFLLECLEDLDKQLREVGAKLFIFR